MKNTLFLFFIAIIFSSCNYFGNSKNVQKKSIADYNLDTISFEIILDSSLVSNKPRYDTIHNVINHFLDELNFGYNVKFEVVDTSDLSGKDTRGKLNQNNIYTQLGLKESDPKAGPPNFKLILFKNSNFFNTANAVCLSNGRDRYIFGDGNLLHSPMLFIHEFGHALGLTHYNEKSFEGCYNVMHESNIGCSMHFSKRQAQMIKTNEYVSSTGTETEPDYCICAHGKINSVEEEYLNSIDRNIDDTPIIGDHISLFTEMYKIELIDGILDSDIKDNLETNFKNEWDRFLFGKGSVSKSDYVADRLQTHKRLRKNNLSRWLREIDMISNSNFDEKEYYFNQIDPLFYKNKIDELNSITCDAILQKLVHHYKDITRFRDLLESKEDIKNCYIKKLNTVYTIPENRPIEGEDSEDTIKTDIQLKSFLENFASNRDIN